MFDHTGGSATPAKNLGWILPSPRLFVLAVQFIFGFAVLAKAESITPDDRAIYYDAFAAAKAGRFVEAERLASKASYRFPAKVITWLALGKARKQPSFEAVADFVVANPDWPGIKVLIRRAGEAIDSSVSDARLFSWMRRYPPTTGVGRLKLAEAHLRSGDATRGQALLRQAWIEGDFTRHDEKAFWRQHRKRLRPEDHVARLDRLIWDEKRSAGNRMLAPVDPEHRALGRARLMLMARIGGVDPAIARVPEELRDHPGLIYERMRWRRRKGFDDRARELLDPLPSELSRPNAWWREGRKLVRDALIEGQISMAYRIASDHRQTDPRNRAEAEWLAGWIALRFLTDPGIAYTHFTEFHRGVRFPISVARGAYWCARAAAAGGHPDLARDWYEKAAAIPTAYYGQLAAAENSPRKPLGFLRPPIPSDQDIKAMNDNELMQAVRVLADLGQRDLIDPFIEQLNADARTPGQHALVAVAALSANRQNLAVKSARRSSWSGIHLLKYGYPLLEIDDGSPPEQALLSSIVRQESGFDPKAVSFSGAHGLMQLMPAMAHEVASRLKKYYSKSRLLTDIEYNIALGRAYISELLNKFGGSYVLALAAYNAGPGRVKRWVRDIGDPRDEFVEPLMHMAPVVRVGYHMLRLRPGC